MRVKAKIRNPNYVPKKEFGFRTINSPSKFTDIQIESVNETKQTSPDLTKQTSPEPTIMLNKSHESLDSIVLPDAFLPS